MPISEEKSEQITASRNYVALDHKGGTVFVSKTVDYKIKNLIEIDDDVDLCHVQITKKGIIYKYDNIDGIFYWDSTPPQPNCNTVITPVSHKMRRKWSKMQRILDDLKPTCKK